MKNLEARKIREGIRHGARQRCVYCRSRHGFTVNAKTDEIVCMCSTRIPVVEFLEGEALIVEANRVRTVR